MDVVCFCHLRWDFVYQRPQHLLSRFAKDSRVFVIEEPVRTEASSFLNVSNKNENLFILTPNIALNPHNTVDAQNDDLAVQQKLLFSYFQKFKLDRYIQWFYTPMAMDLADCLPQPMLTVYDCMDELSAFKFAPSDIRDREKALLQRADIVFTGGYSLYEAKKDQHPNIHPFPSSIDKEHFLRARSGIQQPPEYDTIPSPRAGFFGVIDERFDIALLGELAARRRDWQFVIVGPVVKIDPASLPVADNIHYLGGRSYAQLPQYLSGWDAALILFAINESTRFISPTKTPEYLAGGKPVVSTPIKDVIRPYKNLDLVYIGDDAEAFDKGLDWTQRVHEDPGWLKRVDDYLRTISWDNTWAKMSALIKETMRKKDVDHQKQRPNEYV